MRLGLLAFLDIDRERHIALFAGNETILDDTQITPHQGEEIAGLGMGILPDRVMAVGPCDGTVLDAIAIGEQNWRIGCFCFDAHPVNGHHIGPVGEIADAAEAIGLALRAIDAIRAIEPHQFGIGGRIDDGFNAQRERALRRGGEDQLVLANAVSGGAKPRAIHKQRLQFQLIAIAMQRNHARCAVRVGQHMAGDAHACHCGMELDINLHPFDQIIGWAIIREVDHKAFPLSQDFVLSHFLHANRYPLRLKMLSWIVVTMASVP